MNITLTYKKLLVEFMPAVAASCYKRIKLIASDQESLLLSPNTDLIQSRIAITCCLLNINPLDLNNSESLLWHETIVKPILYQYYLLNNNNKSPIEVIDILNQIDKKFGNTLQSQIKPLELILWADLFLIFMEYSPYKLDLPERLVKWFNNINKLEALQTAVHLVLGDVATNYKEAIKNLPILKSAIYMESDIKVKSVINSIFLQGYENVPEIRIFDNPRLPRKDARNILITSALPYVNNVPHLGNLIGSTLSADVFSRYCRLRNWNSIYVCGTDEYGTCTEVKALEEKSTCREICDKYHAIHADIYKKFNIAFDIFGRTSNPEHTQIVQQVFHEIYSQGLFLEHTEDQLFCLTCDRARADRYVEGICHWCHKDGARGDQCDACGKLINAIELIDPKCKQCNDSPIVKPSTHLYLDLASLQGKLETYLGDQLNSKGCVWSTSAKSITLDWLKRGLDKRCMTRDLKWGVPVPLEKFEDKVFYVWFDAVLGYLSITSAYTSEWRQWWIPTASENNNEEANNSPKVELYQFMAKDNVPFHSVILPSNLIATGKKYTLINQLGATEYLNYENSKFSKSRGQGVFGNDATDSGIDIDVWRYYLLAIRPESHDSSFSWSDFAARNNSELLANLGNFVNRALSFVIKFFDGIIPDFHSEFNDADECFVNEINKLLVAYVDNMDKLRMRDALATILKISGLGNVYIQKNQPWLLVKKLDSIKRAGTIIGIVANVSCLLGVLLGPFMPDTSEKIRIQCLAPSNTNQLLDDYQFRAFLPPQHHIGQVYPLFVKIEDSFVKEMLIKFPCAT